MRLMARLSAMPYPMNKGQEKGSGQPAMNGSKQAGMGNKAIVVLLVGLALAFVHVAEAQQQTKVAKIGGLSPVPRLQPPSSHSCVSCVNLVMSRARTSL